MDNKKIFDTYLTNQYSTSENVNFLNEGEVAHLFRNNKKHLDYNLKLFFKKNIRKEADILDLGCGYGNFMFFLKSYGYMNVIGVDLSTEEIDISRKFFPEYNLIKDDIFDFIQRQNKKFEVIYLSHVLEHIKKEKLADLLEGIKSILTDDGFIIIIIPNCGAYFHSGVARYVDITHEIGFTDKSIRQLLVVNNFKHIEINNYYGPGNHVLNIFRKIALFLFEIFLDLIGFGRQKVYTPSLIAICKK